MISQSATRPCSQVVVVVIFGGGTQILYLGALENLRNNTLELNLDKLLKRNCNLVQVICLVYGLVLPSTTLVVGPV